MTGRPSVSAIVPTRNRPQGLRRAVRSILNQDYLGSVECVVVFDQSELDDLSDVVERRASRSLRAIRNDRTPGPAGARNSGAAIAAGDLLAFCDDDDEWLPSKLRRQVEALLASRSDVAAAGIEVVHEGHAVVRLPGSDRVTLAELLRSRVTAAHLSTLVVRREAYVGAIGPMDEAIPGSYGEDYEWLLRAAKAGPIVVVPHPLVRVHRGPSSFFADRWQTIADAIGYLLEKHPELAADRANLARLEGRVAFAHAALGHRSDARRWAWRSMRHRPIEGRSYLALAVASGLATPDVIQRLANRAGRGV